MESSKVGKSLASNVPIKAFFAVSYFFVDLICWDGHFI